MLYARLIGDHTFSEIAAFTDYQIAEILFHPRDEHGNPTPKKPAKSQSLFDVCKTVWLLREPNLTIQQIQQRFKEKYPNAQ